LLLLLLLLLANALDLFDQLLHVLCRLNPASSAAAS
jgi:hypothetical protein